MHPLAGDFEKFKDSEIETKIQELSRKYFMTHNSDVQQQISMILNDYNQELSKRRQAALEKMMKTADKSIDNLVKVN
jgi:vacuolar-type H+-ATPase subunit E/Vma4